MEQDGNLEQKAEKQCGWIPVEGEEGLYVGGGPFTEDLYLSPWFIEHAERTSASYDPFEYFKVVVKQAGGIVPFVLDELRLWASPFVAGYHGIRKRL